MFQLYPKIVPLLSHDNPIHVGKTMPCLPPMTGNCKHTIYKNGHLGDGLLLFYTQYVLIYHLVI